MPRRLIWISPNPPMPMNFRLRDRSKTPPHGFVWIDPITTIRVDARNHANWISKAIEVRVANRNPLPEEQEMEDQYCRSMDDKSRKQFCDCLEGDIVIPSRGVGSELKHMLASIGIHSCWGCMDTANKMDKWGPDGCEENMAEIVQMMNENAKAKSWFRFLPFKEAGSEALVRRAIRNVRARS